MLRKLKYPIIQAPMAGGFTPVELVVAVSNAGALGSFGAAFTSSEDLRKIIREIRSKTSAPFNINLFTCEPPHKPFHIEPFCNHLKPFQDEHPFEIGPINEAPYYHYPKQIEVLMEEKIPVFSFTFGLPDKYLIRELQKQNTYVMGVATHLEEVHSLAELGVDAIICQGKEAGGHRGTFIGDVNKALIPTYEFIREACKAIKLPIIAAGGIMEKKDVRQAMKEGAMAVQMGTAFLTCNEAGTPPLHKKALLECHDRKAVLTVAFSGRSARGIENRFITEMAPFEKDVPPFPIPIFLLAPMRKAATERGDIELLSLWAGERFSLCKKLPAKELIQSLI
jgi:nitronate monooxygenase